MATCQLRKLEEVTVFLLSSLVCEDDMRLEAATGYPPKPPRTL